MSDDESWRVLQKNAYAPSANIVNTAEQWKAILMDIAKKFVWEKMGVWNSAASLKERRASDGR